VVQNLIHGVHEIALFKILSYVINLDLNSFNSRFNYMMRPFVLDAIFGFRDPNYYKEISLGIINS
jgi:hypothetical protein